MSLFGEVVQAEQAQAQEPRNEQDQRLKVQQFLAAQNMAQQQAAQDALAQQFKQQMMAQENQRQGQELAMRQQGQQFTQGRETAQDQRTAQMFGAELPMKQLELKKAQDMKAAQEGGLSAYMNYLKNPEMQAAAQGGQQGNSGPNVGLVGAQKSPEAAPLSFDVVSKSILKNNPNITPQAFKEAMDQFKPQFEEQDKYKMAEFTKLMDQKYRGAESPAGKVAEDRQRGFLSKNDTGMLKITDLPDAQSRKQAIDFQKSIAATPDLKNQFAKAKELNAKSFDSGAVGADWKVKAARGLGTFAPLVGMTEKEAKDRMTNTTKYEQLIKTTIIPRLRAAFGGRVTNFETQFMNDIEGKTYMSQAERDALIDQSLEFIDQQDAEARDGMGALGVGITEPKAREQAAPMQSNPQAKTIDFNSWK